MTRMGSFFFSGVKQPSVQKASRNQLWIVGTRRRQTRIEAKWESKAKWDHGLKSPKKAPFKRSWNWMEAKENWNQFCTQELAMPNEDHSSFFVFLSAMRWKGIFSPFSPFFLPPSFPPTEFIGLLFFLGWRETRSSRTDENGGRRRRRPRGRGRGRVWRANKHKFPSFLFLSLDRRPPPPPPAIPLSPFLGQKKFHFHKKKREKERKKTNSRSFSRDGPGRSEGMVGEIHQRCLKTLENAL